MRSNMRNSWIHIPYPQPDARLRLFCFPYMGGGAVVFHKWPDHLPSEIEVCAIRIPGRESRFKESPFRRLPPLIKELGNVLQSMLDKPFSFYGHSLGALISFELARLLRKRELPIPVHLFIGACPPPHLFYREPKWLHLSDEEFIKKLQIYGGLPQEILNEPELVELFLPMLRADREMFENYVHNEDSPLNCPISSFGGISDPRVDAEEVVAWQRYTSSEFDSQLLSGDHFFLHSSREELLHIIARTLLNDPK